MASDRCDDLASTVAALGMCTSAISDEAVDGAPHKKGRRESGLTTGAPPEIKIEFEGVNGYVYDVRYYDGRVTFSIRTRACDAEGETWSDSLSVKDWKLFRSVVCRDLDHIGFPEILYVSQWNSATGPEIYRVEADRFFRPSEEFIFLSVCVDRESVIAARGREE